MMMMMGTYYYTKLDAVSETYIFSQGWNRNRRAAGHDADFRYCWYINL